MTPVNDVPRTQRQGCPETSHNRLNLGNYVSADRDGDRVVMRAEWRRRLASVARKRIRLP